MHPNIHLFQVTIRIIEIWHGEDGKCNYSHTFNHIHFLMENMHKYDNVHHHRKHFLFCILECGGKYWLMLHYIWVFCRTVDVIKKDGFSETERGVHTLNAKERRDAKKWHVREKNGVIIRLFCKNVSQMENCRSSSAGFSCNYC